MNKKVITVAFTADNDYVSYVSVVIKSLIENANKNFLYAVKILHKNITNLNQKKLQLLNCDICNIELINISKFLTSEMKEKFATRDYYTIETYFRVLLPDIFPDLDKILYIDSDTIILDDVSKIYNINLGNSWLAATRDLDVSRGIFLNRNASGYTISTYVKDILKLKNPYNYFQAGLILLNLKK